MIKLCEFSEKIFQLLFFFKTEWQYSGHNVAIKKFNHK